MDELKHHRGQGNRHGEGGGGAFLKGGKGPGARAGGREEERGVRKNLGRELSSPEPALGVGMS